MSETHNQMLVQVINLCERMRLVANEGDRYRIDSGCGILYGTLRDYSYKLKNLTEQEIDLHKRSGTWDLIESSQKEMDK